MPQLAIDFTSPSPINQVKLTGQNKAVFEVLSSGKTITLIDAYAMGITALHSRISDLRNKAGISIYGRMIKTSGGSNINEYSLRPFPVE